MKKYWSCFIVLFFCCFHNNETSAQSQNLLIPPDTDNIEIALSLLNNPANHLYHKLPYKTFNWHSKPGLEVKISTPSSLHGYTILINLFDSKGSLIYRAEKPVQSTAETVGLHLDLDTALSDPAEAEITAIKENTVLFSKKLPVESVKLYGKVTDFEDQPIAGAWIITLGHPFQIVTSREDGSYELYLPKGNYNCIAAMTAQYPTQNLENYIWNLPLTQDLEYHFRIGKAEVFRLMAGAMPQNRILSGSFVAWTCSGINLWMGKQTSEEYEQTLEIFTEPYLPNLTKENVRFYLDDIEIKEVPLFEKANIVVSKNELYPAGYRFEFSIPKEIPQKEFHTLKVEIQYPGKDPEGKPIIERGQATIHNITIYP